MLGVIQFIENLMSLSLFCVIVVTVLLIISVAVSSDTLYSCRIC